MLEYLKLFTGPCKYDEIHTYTHSKGTLLNALLCSYIFKKYVFNGFTEIS